MKNYRFQMGALIPGHNRDGQPLDWKKGDVVPENELPGAYLRGWIQSGIVVEDVAPPPAPPAEAPPPEPSPAMPPETPPDDPPH